MKKIIPLLVFIGLTMSTQVNAAGEVNSLDDVRKNINEIDYKIVSLLKERQEMVKQAANFKKDEKGVRDAQRVEAVIKRVINLAVEQGLDPVVAENTYRAMIGSFINLELKEHLKNI